MAMADWHAPVSGTRERVVGNSNESAYEAHGSCADLFASRAFGCSSWIHQEDTVDTGRGFGFGAKAAEGDGAMSKKHLESSIDDFLKDEGIFEEVQAQAVKEVVAWQLAEAMKQEKISKNRMATLLKTSRTQVDRLLDPKNDITLSSLQRAAAMVGRRVSIELI
jgi:predicted XRE-type DNA-binding protein